MIEYSKGDDKYHEGRSMSTLRITESNNDQIEYEVSEEKELRDLLYNLVKQESRVVILEFPNIGIFTLGVGLPYGFIQYSKSGEPPYLVASDDGNAELIDSDDEVEFDANGTPTPIPKRLCLPYDRIIDIIIHFYISHDLPRSLKWEEI
jgi:hypothetical protein